MEVVNTTSTTDPINMYNNLNNFVLNPIVFIFVFLIIIGFFVFSTSLTSNSNDLGNSNSNYGSNIMAILIIAILIVLILINAFQYFFSINVTAYIQGLFSPKTKIDIVVDQHTNIPEPAPVPEIKFKKQVFNIPGNYYDYNNAKAICKAYGSELADYKQIEHAYNKGAEWCNYGWSANQLALFPTQQETYNHLQTIPGHKNDCGRPGINGGFIANPNIKFGVNCFGYKPKITNEEDELMKTSSPYPETVQDTAFQKRVDYWKNKVDEILVSPFNYNTWGAI
jgi:heme/copper-type cytochrome/quinol oxidase subunit 2